MTDDNTYRPRPLRPFAFGSEPTEPASTTTSDPHFNSYPPQPVKVPPRPLVRPSTLRDSEPYREPLTPGKEPVKTRPRGVVVGALAILVAAVIVAFALGPALSSSPSAPVYCSSLSRATNIYTADQKILLTPQSATQSLRAQEGMLTRALPETTGFLHANLLLILSNERSLASAIDSLNTTSASQTSVHALRVAASRLDRSMGSLEKTIPSLCPNK